MIIVVGAGAAGLVAAIFARAAGAPVTVLESTKDGGRKILISGGGRCNILPDRFEPRRFVSDSSPALVQRLLRSWPLKGQRAFFEQDVGVPLVLEPAMRKWFPVSNRARDVRDGLIDLARRRGVVFEFDTELNDAHAEDDVWKIETNRGGFTADALVLATGGLSVPATGSTGAGLQLARALGHVVHQTYPALTPLTAADSPHAHLAGVSLDVSVRASSEEGEAESQGGFLFTHGGYSGPSVLDVSHIAVRGTAARPRPAVRVRWSDADASTWSREFTGASNHSTTALVVTVVSRRLPQRLAEQLVAECAIPADRKLAELRRDERTRLVDRLTAYELPWTGDEGYKKAEVTGGGVALEELDPRTLESRRHPRLFMCGEMCDAFGPIGGHNFAWAWSTGRLAGIGAAQAIKPRSAGQI